MPLGSLTVRLSVGKVGTCSGAGCGGTGGLAKGGVMLGPLPRGVYELSDPQVFFGDLLGLVTVAPRVRSRDACRAAATDSLFDRLYSDAGRAAGDGRRVLLRRAAGFDFHSVREYEQGESLAPRALADEQALRTAHGEGARRQGPRRRRSDPRLRSPLCRRRPARLELRRRGSSRRVARAGTRRSGTAVTLVSTGGTRAVVPVRSAARISTAPMRSLAAAEPDALDGLGRFLAGEHCGRRAVS